MSRSKVLTKRLAAECDEKIERLLAENARLRKWVIATAISLSEAGLTLEEYNAITVDVRRGHRRLVWCPHPGDCAWQIGKSDKQCVCHP